MLVEKKVAALLLLVVVQLATLNMLLAVSQQSYSIRGQIKTTISPLKHSIHGGETYRITYLVIPASSLPGLIGAKIGSLVAAICSEERELLAPVKILPQRFIRTFLPSGNTTILLPSRETDTITADDILVVQLPIPPKTGKPSPNKCSWSVYAAKHKLKNRIVVQLSPGARIIDYKGASRLDRPTSFAIYFDYKRAPFMGDPPYLDISQLEKIARILGLKPPKATLPVTRLDEEKWNSWLEKFRSKIVELEVSKTYLRAETWHFLS